MAIDEHRGRRRIVVGVAAGASLLIVFSVVLSAIAAFPFQLVHVVGHAMEPGLRDQQRLIVNKLAYLLHDPSSGDVVMMYYPLDPRKSFVKRVIAREGDTVRVVDGHVFVNESPVDDSYANDLR